MTVRVYPGAKNPTHEISLSDGIQTWGLRLAGGEKAIKETPIRPSSIKQMNEGSKFGDWEPGMSQIEQRSWAGGRGVEDFVEDNKGFYDSMMAWTILPGKLLPAPQWHFAEGVRESYGHKPGNLDWQALLEEKRFISIDFTVGASGFEADKAYIWLRRVGSPAEAMIAVYEDSSGNPSTALANGNDAVGILNVTDVVSVWQGVDISEMVSLSASTKYHLVVYGDEIDNAANHWEVGIDKSQTGSFHSSAGGSWTVGEFKLYHRVLGEAIKRKWHFFTLKGSLYAVDERRDGAGSTLLINGDRGKATSTTGTTLVDSHKNWLVDDWAGAWVKIVGGKGKGQTREISSNDATSLTVADWDVQLDSTSLYLIYATEIWKDITPTSGDLIDGVVCDVIVVNEQVLFAQGQDDPIMKMRWNDGASPPVHEFDDDGTNTADLLQVMVDEINGLQVWRVNNDVVSLSKAASTVWLTDMSFGAEIFVGENDLPIHQIFEKSAQFFAFKSDGMYGVSADGKVSKNFGNFGAGHAKGDGRVVLVQGEEMYFSWGSASLIYLSEGHPQAIGPDLGSGLPEIRKGPISSMVGLPDHLLTGINAGTLGFSSVLIRACDSPGWHEIFRGWEIGQAVENICWQTCEDTRSRLWISVGGELVYQEWPLHTNNPLQDTDFKYQHECMLETASIDMGAARLPKFIKEVGLISENLTTGVEVHLDYQTEDEVGKVRWIKAETFYRSPEDCLPIQEGNLRKIRLRLRLVTNNAKLPPVVLATVLEGFARIPMKYQWEMEVMVGDMQRELSGGGRDQDPDKFILWLKQAAIEARKITMRSIWEGLDGQIVIVEPPMIERSFTNRVMGEWGGKVMLTVREV